MEEVGKADVLIHVRNNVVGKGLFNYYGFEFFAFQVCDRSNPVWEKQRETVLRELDAIGCVDTPIVELWNKIDQMPDPEDIRYQVTVEHSVLYSVCNFTNVDIRVYIKLLMMLCFVGVDAASGCGCSNLSVVNGVDECIAHYRRSSQ